jgi:predicted chitinase
LNSAMSSASITSCARRSAFIAQLAHESGQLRYLDIQTN